MEPLRVFPLFYCPPGVAKPGHCPHRAAVGLIDGQGPDGLGGMMYGGPYQPALAHQWSKTGGGWWINLAGKKPGHFMRTETLPGRTVVGADPEHLWVVPQIINADMTCAIPQRFGTMRDGSYGWLDEPKWADLIGAVRAIRLGDVKSDATMIATAIALLAANYHLSEHELAVAGWLSTDFLLRIIVAGGGGEAEGVL
jgi:hypothetical protein